MNPFPTWHVGLSAWSCTGYTSGLASLARRFQDVSVLGHHQDGDEVDHGKTQELCLLGFLHISVDHCSKSVDVHVLEQLLWILDRTGGSCQVLQDCSLTCCCILHQMLLVVAAGSAAGSTGHVPRWLHDLSSHHIISSTSLLALQTISEQKNILNYISFPIKNIIDS